MRYLVLGLLSAFSVTVFASEDTASSLSLTELRMDSSETSTSLDAEPVRRADALSTDSIYYSLPQANRSMIEIGGYSQDRKSSGTSAEMKSNVFNFKQTKGLSNNVAVNFGLDYFLVDESSSTYSSGISEITLGARSSFLSSGLKWIYGMNVSYIGNDDASDGTNVIIGGAAKIGFEKNSSNSRWGLETEATTKNNTYTSNRINLVGFFEFPFFRQITIGTAAGLDMTSFNLDKQNSFGKIYSQYELDSSAAVQLMVKQSVESRRSQSETQAGLALNKVF